MDAAFWNERYAAPVYAYGEAPNAFVAEIAPEIPDGPVLCLAEGEGRNAVHLATLGHRVTAVDQSEMGFAKARRLAKSHGVQIETIVSDLADYSIAASAWAGIVATFAHLPPALRQRIHREAVTGLQPGGIFVLEAYTPAQLAFDTGGPKSPELLMTLAGLREELSGLELLIACERERDVIEGSFHRAGRPWCKFSPDVMSEGFVRRGGWWVVGQFLLLLAIAILGITGRASNRPLPLLFGGLGLFLIAILCGIAGVFALGRNLTPFPRPKAKVEFVRGGIYSLMRHPLYTAFFCAVVGWSPVWSSWLASAILPALAIFLDAKARHEEVWLRRQFPDCADYESCVRRFIPWIY